MALRESKFNFHKNSEGIFKSINDQKDKNLPIDLVCQKFQFVSKEEQGVIYYACKVIETTDNDLKQFIGHAIVQKVSAKHQAFVKPDDVISFMLDNYFKKVPDVNE